MDNSLLNVFKILKKSVLEKRLRIMVPDKGGKFVVIKTELNRAITIHHLSDRILYEEANRAAFEDMSK